MSLRLPIPSAPRLWIALGVLSAFGQAEAPAGPTGLLVPAYFYPTIGQDWKRLDAAAAQVPLTAILNPASGPGTEVDPRYVEVTKRLKYAGGKIVGYVSTSYGARTLDLVQADIARYARFYPVDGFFIDEMDSSPVGVWYYRAIYTFIKALDPRYQVVGNPGTATHESYLTTPTADALVTFEGTAASHPNAPPLNFARQHPSDRLAHIVYGVATPEAMLETIARAAERNVGAIYITDRSNASNPYDRLPTYFEREVAALRGEAPPRRPFPWLPLSAAIAGLAMLLGSRSRFVHIVAGFGRGLRDRASSKIGSASGRRGA